MAASVEPPRRRHQLSDLLLTRDVLLSGRDVALVEELFRLSIDHQQSGLVSSGFDGRHHLGVLHPRHRHAVHLQTEKWSSS